MRKRTHLSIPDKANVILKVILGVFLLMLFKVANLSIFQHDRYLDASRQPRQKAVQETAKRGTIRDRYNIPLAINKVRYQAAVNYSEIREIPSVAWARDVEGKRVKVFKRKEHIKTLSELLARELSLDPQRVEDLIHSKAALYFHIPFVLKDDISEKEYYRLLMLEKDYPGILVRAVPKRDYPKNMLASDVIGYMGAINRQEFEEVISEMRNLRRFLRADEEGESYLIPEGFESTKEIRQRLQELEKRAYTINDYVGKGGVEGYFEEELRGFQGEKKYYSDAQGNLIWEYPGGRPPMSGERLLLTISSELQEYAEKLLVMNEDIRQKQELPYILGGAIVAMDPNSGDVLALASHPRFDPNDYIHSGDPEKNRLKQNHLLQWLENEYYISQVWNGKRPLVRRIYQPELDREVDDEKWITWNTYLDTILPGDHPVKLQLLQIETIKEAIKFLSTFDRFQEICSEGDVKSVLDMLYSEQAEAYSSRLKEEATLIINKHSKEMKHIKSVFDSYFGEINHRYDRILFIDLVRLSINHQLFDSSWSQNIEAIKLKDFQSGEKALVVINDVVREISRGLFHSVDFQEWRAENEKAFLREKRDQEKKEKRYARPYIDYLDKQESSMFHLFWEENRMDLILSLLTGKKGSQKDLEPYFDTFVLWNEEISAGAHAELDWRNHFLTLKRLIHLLSYQTVKPFLLAMRSYSDLNRPLIGSYPHLRKENGNQLEKHLAAAFYPIYGMGYGKSYAYRHATVQGSIFKLVTAYVALYQKYLDQGSRADLNPLTMVDRVFKEDNTWYVGETISGKPIPKSYQGGVLTQSLSKSIGTIDISKAIQTSSNSYFGILAGDHIKHPNDLKEAAWNFSFGQKTGLELPMESEGVLPDDLEINKSGLYSFSIGQHSLTATPLQTAVMLSALANGGKVLKPKMIHLRAGSEYDQDVAPLTPKENYPHKENLDRVGIDFPLFTANLNSDSKHHVHYAETEVIREVPLPKEVQKPLFKGLEGVFNKLTAEGYWAIANRYIDYPEAPKSMKRLKGQMVGKTSSGEIMEVIGLDKDKGIQKSTHVWFGGISYEDEDKEKPELVVVVYLRFGKQGKDAAPIAAQLVEKWREIKKSASR